MLGLDVLVFYPKLDVISKVHILDETKFVNKLETSICDVFMVETLFGNERLAEGRPCLKL